MDDNTNPVPESAPISGPAAVHPATPPSPSTTGNANASGSTGPTPGFAPGGPAPVIMTKDGWVAEIRQQLANAADGPDGQKILDQLIGLIEAFLFSAPNGKAVIDAGSGITFKAKNPFGIEYDINATGSATISIKQA